MLWLAVKRVGAGVRPSQPAIAAHNGNGKGKSVLNETDRIGLLMAIDALTEAIQDWNRAMKVMPRSVWDRGPLGRSPSNALRVWRHYLETELAKDGTGHEPEGPAYA